MKVFRSRTFQSSPSFWNFGKHDPGLSELNLFEIVTKLEKGGSTTEISWHEEIDPSAATTSTSSALASWKRHIRSGGAGGGWSCDYGWPVWDMRLLFRSRDLSQPIRGQFRDMWPIMAGVWSYEMWSDTAFRTHCQVSEIIIAASIRYIWQGQSIKY